jgi:hypothetical protein
MWSIVLAKLQMVVLFLGVNSLSAGFRWYVRWHRKMEGPQQKEGKRCLWIHRVPELLWYALASSAFVVYGTFVSLIIPTRCISIQNPPVWSCYEHTPYFKHVCLNIFWKFCMSICFQVLIMLLINIIRPREVGLPSLSWNWAAEQQGTARYCQGRRLHSQSATGFCFSYRVGITFETNVALGV